MLIDKQNMVSNSQTLTSGTITSTDVIDLGTERAGQGTLVNLFVSFPAALVGGTSVQFVIQTATDAAFTSPITRNTTRAFTTAELNALGGSPVDLGDVPHKADQFLRLQYVLVGTYTGASAVTAGVSGPSIQSYM